MTILLSPAEALGRVPSKFTGVMVEPEPRIVGHPCACGDMVWADPNAPTAGVTRHNETDSHRAWAKAQEDEE